MTDMTELENGLKLDCSDADLFAFLESLEGSASEHQVRCERPSRCADLVHNMLGALLLHQSHLQINDCRASLSKIRSNRQLLVTRPCK